MGIIDKLDFNLQKYTERYALVNFLDRQGLLQNCTPGELDKISNYLLYSEDVNIDVELKEGSKKKVSYEELIESTIGENTIQNHEQSSIYRIPRPTIDKEKDKDVPGMKDLWEAIDIISEKYNYCKNVLEGKIELNPDRALIPTYQTKYYMREWMIDLRREQFLLKDIFKPVIGGVISFACTQKPQYIGMKIGNNVLCDCEMNIDYTNWQHIYNLLKYYSGMKSHINNDPYNEWWVPYEFLDELIKRVRWTPEQWIILTRKINKVPNEEIVAELERMGHKSYSVNYISTIFKQHISKRITKQAILWWNEKFYKLDGSLEHSLHWKVCPSCGRTLYADEINFGKFIDGSWKNICKDCFYKEKAKKELRRKKNE